MPSTTSTLLLATSSLAAGTVLGYWLHSHYPYAHCTSLSTVSRWLSGSLDAPESDASSAGTTPRLTARSAGGDGEPPLKMLLLVRLDAGMDRGQVLVNGSRAVLQLFKKLYKRAKQTNLLSWDRQGGMVVPLACNKHELVHARELAVHHGIATHSIKDRGSQDRIVMAVGPADSAALEGLASGLALL
ncbi:MAG: hypothetical protein EBS29_13450 [Chloroflexia bacterium]|nr:hypothetical protein [Chloroflexia bacterium]